MTNKRLGRLAWVAGFSLFACTTTQSTHTVSANNNRESFGSTPLPSLDEVRNIARRVVRVPRVEIPPTSVASWDLGGPSVGGIEAGTAPSTWNATDPLERAFSAMLTGRTVTPSESMRCYARELTRFFAANTSAPPAALKQFMAAGCRVHTQGLASAAFTITADPRATAEQVTQHIVTSLPQQLADFAAHAEGMVGIATSHVGNRHAVVVLSGSQAIRFDPESPAPDGSVLVQGEIVGARPEDTVYVVANQPDGGAKLCTHEASSTPPRFAVRCPVPRTGAPTVISVSKIPRGSFLGFNVADALVGGSEPVRRWQLAQYPEVLWVDESRTRAQLGRTLNSIRAGAGRQPVEFVADAETTACSVSPHVHMAITSNEARENGEAAMLAMMAGFGIPRLVRSGLVGAVATPSRDIANVLSTALVSPGARLTLMDPLAQYAALCPVHTDEGFAGLVFVTWRAVDEASMHEVDTIWSRIQEERARRGVAAIQRWDGPPLAAATAIRAIDSGTLGPSDAMRASLDSAVEELGSGATGGVRVRMFSTFSTGSAVLPVPDGLLDPTITMAHIASTWYRAPGSPWAVRLFLVYSPGDGTTVRTN